MVRSRCFDQEDLVLYRRTRDGSLDVSVIGIGTYGLAGTYGPKDPAAIRGILRAAYDRGVTLFDTAPTYDDAERVLGETLKDVRPRLAIATKVPASPGKRDCSYQTVIDACERSLDEIGTDYLDLYQIHFDDGITPVDEIIRAFEALKAQGKIRAYGVGHVSKVRAAEYVEKGSPSILMGELSAVSRKYYLEMVPVLRAGTADFMGFSLAGRGMLTHSSVDRADLAPGDIRQMDALFAGERRQSSLRVKEELREIGSHMGASVAQMAIAWAISQEAVLAGLVGPSTLSHLDEDLLAAEVELDESTMDRIAEFLSSEAAVLELRLKDEVLSILDREITDTERGASQIIYAIEGLVETGLAKEEDLVSAMGKVIRIMKSGEGGLSALDAVRRDLIDHVGTA